MEIFWDVVGVLCWVVALVAAAFGPVCLLLLALARMLDNMKKR
jgi:hypothetical protein